MSRLDLNDIRLLTQIVEHGSYAAASRAIGIPKSTISQRIAALERAVGTGLLRRTSRSLSLTDTGALLLPHAREIEALSRRIDRDVFDQGPGIAGTLRVSCSVVLGQFALSTLLPGFLAEHKDITVQIETSNRLIDLVGEGFDMALRGHVGPLRDSTLLQRVVARSTWSLSASPAWVNANGLPAAPADLLPDQVLFFSGAPGPPVLKLSSDGQSVSIALSPRLVSDDMITLRDSAISGGGVACLPSYVVASSLRAGHLVPILPDWVPPPSSISVLTPPKAQSSRLAQAFSDFLAHEMPRLVRGLEAAGSEPR